ncbi:hypothetical protein BKH46_08425 [Helicobacter sp. 12S02634-8]|nr:hypothetical protein BKH46_08425 [Helicobacter sp. 12S02634-8]
MQKILFRIPKEALRKRYYEVELFQTLFDDFGVKRVYGAVGHKPTGSITNFYPNKDQAYNAYQAIILKKMKKGYN